MSTPALFLIHHNLCGRPAAKELAGAAGTKKKLKLNTEELMLGRVDEIQAPHRRSSAAALQQVNHGGAMAVLES